MDARSSGVESISATNTMRPPQHYGSQHGRPRMVTHPSNSAPSTPQQLPRDHILAQRTPSPTDRGQDASPCSASSESTRAVNKMGPVSDKCRFQSTQTSRRRVAYNIGADPLPPAESPALISEARPHELVQQADSLYQKLLPSEESDERRKRLVEKIQAILREEIPNGKVEAFVFGSSGNLLCMNDSDVDICVVVQGSTIVCNIASILARRKLERIVCVHAKAVPIVKIWDPETQMSCDININNHAALTNTQLVKAYMSIGKPVVSRGLAMLVKHWTQRRLLNEASGGTLSSYTWTLLVINFLQSLNILPVIPLVDEAGNQKTDFTDDVTRINASYKYPDRQPRELGYLLVEFFRYYAYIVDYETTVFSVRQGRRLPKTSSRWANIANNNRFCIEEPFTTHRNLGNTADDTAARGIHEELRSAFDSLATGQPLDLDGVVCKKFEFVKEDYSASGSIFQKPRTERPLPTLTRSRSQAGRGGKHASGGQRSNRQNDQRPSSGNRRASSGPLGGPPLVGLPLQDLLPHQLPPSVMAPEVNAAYMNLEGQKVDLRMRQMNLQRGYQMPDLNSLQQQQRRSFAGLQMPSNGMSASQRRSDAGPHPPIIPQGYYMPYGYGYPSSIAMSPSSSQQGANTTTPGSPMMQSVPTIRQHMSMPSSPGPSSRSHSQPARPGEKMPRSRQPQLMHGDYFYPYFPPDMQMMPHFALQPLSRGNGYPSPRLSSQPPVLHGMHILDHAHSASGPRQYVGYGISNQATPEQPAAALDIREIPAFDDLHRPGRGRSPRDSESAIAVGSRSPSPGNSIPTSGPVRDHSTQLSSTTSDNYFPVQTPQSEAAEIVGLPNRTLSQPPTLDQRRPGSSHSNDTGPLIVNGSNRPGGSGDLTSQTDLASKQESFDAWKQHVLQPQNGEPTFNYPQRYSMPLPQYRHSDSAISNPATFVYAPASFDAGSYGFDHRKPEQNVPNAWAAGKQINTAHLVPAAVAGHMLSPVTEQTRTPSPEFSRENGRNAREGKLDAVAGKKKAHANGYANHSRASVPEESRFSIYPPPPTPLRTGENGAGPGPASVNTSASNKTPTTPSSASSSTGPWQQAGGKKKKNRGGSTGGISHASGGHPMPANASERKGG